MKKMRLVLAATLAVFTSPAPAAIPDLCFARGSGTTLDDLVITEKQPHYLWGSLLLLR